MNIQSFVKERGLDASVGSDQLEEIVQRVLEDLPDKVEAYKKGKKGLIGLFVGEVMKRTRGKADPKITNDLLREALK
jgi:aspartyl-tRNA(Asn)/glutamyl-tRNA(Gln) amidotransferase subunit B